MRNKGRGKAYLDKNGEGDGELQGRHDLGYGMPAVQDYVG